MDPGDDRVEASHPPVHLGGELMERVRRLEPLRAGRIALLFLRVGIMNELQYRVNFFIHLFQSLLSLGTGLVVLALVFSYTSELNGWTRPQLLAVLGVQILMGGLIHAVIQPNMELLMEQVRDGKLDYPLTKPEDAQVLVSVRRVRIWQAVDMVSGAIVLTVGIAGLNEGIGPVDALAFAAALLLGGVMIYSFWLIIACVSFWVVRLWEAIELFEGLFQTGRWPVGIYPIWLRVGLTYLVPIAFAVTVPAEAVTSRLHASTLLGALAFAGVLFGFTRWLWKRGLRRYSGASA
jgi:ABC-2 type transport system permease protein